MLEYHKGVYFRFVVVFVVCFYTCVGFLYYTSLKESSYAATSLFHLETLFRESAYKLAEAQQDLTEGRFHADYEQLRIRYDELLNRKKAYQQQEDREDEKTKYLMYAAILAMPVFISIYYLSVWALTGKLPHRKGRA